jgi:hypothetical protein
LQERSRGFARGDRFLSFLVSFAVNFLGRFSLAGFSFARGLADFPKSYTSGRIFGLLRLWMERGDRMKKIIAYGALALSLISSAARADERRGSDAALGALSGAVVFGPVGAVAGAVVGYTAGPSIAHSWGFRRSRAARERQKSAQRDTVVSPVSQPVPNRQAGTPAATQTPPPPKTASSALPPVQGLE